jgi:hypothetical protein
VIQNYRINFGGENIDYKDNFSQCKQYFPILERLYKIMANDRVEYAWHFFEPYVEFTWVDDKSEEYNENIIQDIVDILAENNLKPSLIHRPKDGVIIDWYCKSPEEQRFGMESYALSAKMAMLFWKYQDSIAKGCGEENQYMRRTHVLANQLAINYAEESKLLAMRSHLAILFWKNGHAEAVAEYEKTFGVKYL